MPWPGGGELIADQISRPPAMAAMMTAATNGNAALRRKLSS